MDSIKSWNQFDCKSKKGVMKNQKVLVTDCYSRKSISAIRSLGKAGNHVYALADTWLAPGLWSKYVTKRKVIKTGSIFESSDFLCFIDDNFDYKPTGQKPIFMPMEEDVARSAIVSSDLLDKSFLYLLPHPDSFEIACNKLKTVQLAQSMGIPAPKTYELSLNVDKELLLKRISAESTNISEFVVKPFHGSGSRGVEYLNFEELRSFIRREPTPDFIIQERIPKSWQAIGVSLLFDHNSECKLSFVHRRLAEFPTSGGPSTSRVSTQNKLLVDYSEKLLRQLNWVGVAMVEWKYDPETKEASLMEINPRFWGSLELAVRSGANFPKLYVDCLTKKNVQKQNEYRIDVRCDWLWPGGIMNYIKTPRNKRESIGQFLVNSLKYSEEFDKHDLRGTLSALILTPFLIFKKQYRRLLQR